MKADVAFEMFRLLDVPFFSFHDRDIAPEGATLTELNRERPRDRRDLREEDGDGQGAAPLGHRQPVLQPPLHGGCRDQSRPGRLRLCRGAGEERARR